MPGHSFIFAKCPSTPNTKSCTLPPARVEACTAQRLESRRLTPAYVGAFGRVSSPKGPPSTTMRRVSTRAQRLKPDHDRLRWHRNSPGQLSRDAVGSRAPRRLLSFLRQARCEGKGRHRQNQPFRDSDGSRVRWLLNMPLVRQPPQTGTFRNLPAAAYQMPSTPSLP
jgi:hypothetical protein